MISRERHQKILDMMQKTKVVKITDITSTFGVSTETARRDLHILESQNLCKKIYGGAALISPIASEPSYSTREVINSLEKIAIGKKAAELVADGQTIILDVGTTIIELARSIKNKNNVIVLTNSLSIVNELANTDINLHIMGGKLNPSFLSMSGSLTLSALKQFFVDIAFIGAGGITLQDGISDYNIEEAQVRKFSIERANKTILLADSSKFGINAFAMVSPLEEVDVIVTDWKICPKVLADLRERKIEVLIADKPDEV
ncbi:MAG TPA: DeoR/GlpR family DNA-binding transcription regulator [Clostridia bacterium]|nr:DeoR/GlpR family DNA-binding transcription regulator [Clostridia bacterium]